MIKKISLLATLLLMIAVMVAWAAPVEAVSQHPQAVYLTPTPNADGKIIYVVQKENETCLSIYLTTGVEIDQIRQLNNLDEDCTIQVGQELLLAVQQVSTVEPTLAPTLDPSIPTPTPFNGMGQICVSLFFDTNGNAMRETGEPPIENGAFSIQDKENKTNEDGLTGLEPACKDVPEGEYNISVAPPEGFNPTTSMNYAITVKAGDKNIIPFGAQPSSVASTPNAGGESSTPSAGDSSNVWLLLVGLLLILAGIGMGVYFIFLSRKNRVL